MNDVLQRAAFYALIDSGIYGAFAIIAWRRVHYRATRNRVAVAVNMTVWSIYFLIVAWIRLSISDNGPALFELNGHGTEVVRIAATASLVWLFLEYGVAREDVIDRRDPGVVPRTRATDWVPEAGKET